MHARRWLLALAAAAWAGGAAAHAGLVASIPADGAVLAAPPSSVELRFTEAVTPVQVRFFAGSAAPLVLPAPKGASEVVKLALPANLREGLYTVSFRVISADSHPVGGSIVFGIGERPPPHVAAAASDSGLSPATTVLRAVRDLALLIAAGGALFALGMASFPAERALLAAAGALAIVASVAGVGLQGADIVGGSVGSPEAWHTGLFSSVGLSAGVAAAGALSIALAAALSSTKARAVLLLAGAVAVIASLPLTGHAMTARPAGVAIAALAAHGLAAAFWIGSLGALLAILRVPMPSERQAAAVLRRFSRWGMLAVAVLVIAGATFALLQAGSVVELFSSRYGWLVAGKVVLLLALLLLAILNRFRWLPMLERGARAAVRRLRWSIAGEAALAVCVIGVTAVLVQTPPPRAVGPEHGYAQTFAHKEDVVELSVWPAHAGPNAIVLRFRDREGLPFDPEELFVEVGNQAAGVEPAVRPMRRVGAGQYRRDGNELAFPGVWTIEVQARMGASGVATFRSQVPIH